MGGFGMGSSLKIKLYVFAAVLLLVLAGGVYGYFGFYTRTPEYAVQAIENALDEHDRKKFERYVDVDSLLDHSYDALMQGLMENDKPLTPDAMDTVNDFVQMLKAPLVTSFKTALLNYVSTGEWSDAEPGKSDIASMDAGQVLERSGLQEAEFRKMDSLAKDKEAGTAVAKVRIFQEEAQSEFVLDVLLVQQADGDWRVTEITNFHDFIAFVINARQDQLKNYADSTGVIISRHDENMLKAQEQFSSLLSRGALGNDETRKALREFMEGTIKADWEKRKAELEEVPVPAAARTLHKLRLRICDLHIAYAAGYAAWMTDKKADTIREADAQLKQAKTLEQEEKFLLRRVNGMVAPALTK